MNIDRKLATVRTVEYLKPIEGADRIEIAVIDGWQVVVKKGEFQPGNLAIYFEIDSWVPHTLAPFLTCDGHYPKVFNGVEGQRLKTIKLKGQLSQGLLLPLLVAEEHYGNPLRQFNEGEDLTEGLGIQKWEKSIPAQLAGTVKGNFPTFLRRTDQERIQNVYKQMSRIQGPFEITEKLDGSSMTVYAYRRDPQCPAETGVCSRNLDLKADENNSFWAVAFRDQILDKLASLNRNLALQGELIGPGIQGNSYGLDRHEFYVFDIFNIDTQDYLQPGERERIVRELGLNHVPTIGILHMSLTNVETGDQRPAWAMEALLKYAEGESLLNNKVDREGIVWKNVLHPSIGFKVVSNAWLLKKKE